LLRQGETLDNSLHSSNANAVSVLINYWKADPSLNAAWIAMCLVVVVIINAFGAGAYGEAEFWFASIKGIPILSQSLFFPYVDSSPSPYHRWPYGKRNS
jgi:amino acid transporter